jgi:hypothetical protein
MRMHVSVCSASLGIWLFTQNGQPTGVHISCNFVSVRAPKSDNFYLGIRSSVFAFSSCPATFSHYSVCRSFTWHNSRRITLGYNTPPPHDAYLAKSTANWHTLYNSVHFTTALRPPQLRVQQQMTAKCVPIPVALLSDEKSQWGCRLTSPYIASPYFITSRDREDNGYSVYHCYWYLCNWF